MPLIIFTCKGIPATRRERIETAVEAGGRHVKEQYEGWIAADPFRGGVRVVITGPQSHRTPTSGTISRDIGVSVIRSVESIQHMPPQRVSFRQEGMIEVISRIARHAQFFHHPA